MRLHEDVWVDADALSGSPTTRGPFSPRPLTAALPWRGSQLSTVTRRVIPKGREALLTSENTDIHWGGRGQGERERGSPRQGHRTHNQAPRTTQIGNSKTCRNMARIKR